MKKKVCICFVGQYRTFEKCAGNIIEKFFNPNKNNYDIDIIINTGIHNINDNKYKTDNYYKNLNYKFYEQNELIAKFNNTYPNLKKIMFFDPVGIHGSQMFEMRIQNTIDEMGNFLQEYDFLIFIRLDVVSNSVFNFDRLRNNLLINIPSVNKRDYYFYNRDWDWCVCGDINSIKKYISKTHKTYEKNILSQYAHKINLNGTDINNPCIPLYDKIYDMYENNIDFVFLNDVLLSIIR